MSSRLWLISDEQWDVLRGLLPPQRPATGRPRRDHRQVLEGIIYRYRTGVAWRDLPERFGPWKTVWKRHCAYRRSMGMNYNLFTRPGVAWVAGGEQGWVLRPETIEDLLRLEGE